MDWLQQIGDKQVRFENRPISFPGDMRSTWRIPTICVLLKYACRGKRANLEKLLFLGWLMRTRSKWNAVAKIVDHQELPFGVHVRFDPSLSRALNLAIGGGLVIAEKGKRFVLANEGDKLAEEVKKLGIFDKEIEYLRENKSKFTDAAVRQLISWRG